MNDPRNVVHEHPDKKVQKALQDQQKKDLALGNCVMAPGPEWRLADKEMRVKCIALAKRLAVAGQWVGRIDKKSYSITTVDTDGKPKVETVEGWNAQVTFGHWWVKD